MTVKDDPPIVHATWAPDDPEIDLTASSPAPFSQALDNPPPIATHAVAASAPPAMAGTTTTTTTYTIPPQQQHQQQNSQSAPAAVHHGNYGRNSTGTKCPFCQTQMVTRTRDRSDVVTILAMLLILLIFWPLFWLPLCIPACKTTDHYCSNCNRKVGSAAPCS